MSTQTSNAGYSIEQLLANKKFRNLVQNPDFLTAEICRQSYSEFFKEFWYLVPPGDPYVHNWHIDYIAESFQNVITHVSERKPKEHDMIVNVPPGESKSSLASIMLPAWAWTRWPWMQFICASHRLELSTELSDKCRGLIRSDKYQRLFPYLKIREDKDTKHHFGISFKRNGRWVSGGSRFATSVGGTVTGFHAHVIVVDDPIDPRGAFSELTIQDANRWLSQTLSTRKTDKEVTVTILIMQRLAQDDPTGYWLEKYGDQIYHICLPGEVDGYKEKVRPIELLLNYKDGLLDPVRLSRRALRGLEAELGQYGYAGQIGQDPTPAGGGMFKVDQFQKMAHRPGSHFIRETVRYWDHASTPGGGAYTCGVKMSRTTDNRYIVEDVKRGQWGTDERERIKRQTAEEDSRDALIGLEQEPGSSGKDQILYSVKLLAGFAVFVDPPKGDKVYRADPYSVQVNNGNVYLIEGDWNREYIEEFRYFPKSRYKDQVDASSGAFNRLTQKKLVRIIR